MAFARPLQTSGLGTCYNKNHIQTLPLTTRLQPSHRTAVERVSRQRPRRLEGLLPDCSHPPAHPLAHPLQAKHYAPRNV